jgi:hypothetical protein
MVEFIRNQADTHCHPSRVAPPEYGEDLSTEWVKRGGTRRYQMGIATIGDIPCAVQSTFKKNGTNFNNPLEKLQPSLDLNM